MKVPRDTVETFDSDTLFLLLVMQNSYMADYKDRERRFDSLTEVKPFLDSCGGDSLTALITYTPQVSMARIIDAVDFLRQSGIQKYSLVARDAENDE